MGTDAAIGKQWAVFIAIDRYKEWKPLSNPVKDAKEIRDILKEQYFIDEVVELYDQAATGENIRKLFGEELRRKVGNNDSVFVFYAGHGQTDSLTNTGFWIPVDGADNHYAQTNWLSNQQVRKLLSALPAKHVFLISDACFSGDILDISRGSSPQINSEYYRRAYSRVSRQVMTSGASESVPDSSEFAQRLKSALRRAEGLCIDPEGIFITVREVRTTQPMLGTIAGSEHQSGGSFLFFRRGAGNIAPGAPPQRPVPDGFVRIEGGTFTMGSPSSEAERWDGEGPQHTVSISAFYMGKYEITQKEWVAVMGSNPSYFKGDNLPVENVSWYDAIEYCNKRSEKEGLRPAYTIDKSRLDPNNNAPTTSETDWLNDNIRWIVTVNKNANGYRLPTEAEWEYACRAATTTPFSMGNNITTNQANYNGNYPYNNNAKGEFREKTTAVGSFAPNRWGLYDMHGNVFEWCWDWHDDYSTITQTDPTGAASGSNRVLRGGGWFNDAQNLRSANRFVNTASNRYGNSGFRVVRP
ncbi:hypothetical protein AGMMS50268_09860 [Spirochaetia bacterium]|nr:hypothetical protein AGMMS50268_09860 [Spirochaetia bacterium]